MSTMKYNEAFKIIENLNDDKITIEEKGFAIHKILELKTYNSVTKAMMIDIIRFLFNEVFEWEGD